MLRRIAVLLAAAAAALAAQDATPQREPYRKPGELKRDRRPRPARKDDTERPPEEDESVAPTTFAFNPLQSEKDVRVGNYYFKQRNYRAALGRYRDATQWNGANSDAWLRLGEAAEKTKDRDIARQAYEKYLALEPDARNAAEIRKKLQKLR